MKKLFGTDGVRGIANQALTPQLAFDMGRAGAYCLTQGMSKPKIIIGKDTRISGDLLEAAMTAGICSVGVDVLTVGIVSTPALAFLTRTLQCGAGVMISASHNPVIDNGIKFFSQKGFKLPDEKEIEIEQCIFEGLDSLPQPISEQVGRVIHMENAVDTYVEFAMKSIQTPLSGLKVVLDCANGAAYDIAPRVLKGLGACVIPMNHEPDGVNINVQCGSTHPEGLQQAVIQHHADIGIAHDGDADRVIIVDEKGNILDGDFIMAICAHHLAQKDELPNRAIVATVMSNLGLDIAFDTQIKGEIFKTKVGDRYVLEEMLKRDIILGGEQSGHIIFLNHNTTGDGVITALQLLQVMKETGKPLSELAQIMKRLPQVLINAQVKQKDGWDRNEAIQKAIDAVEQQLGKTGRVLVRPSGTEPLIRVMVEGQDEGQLHTMAEDIVKVIKKELG